MQSFYITTAIDYVNGSPHLGHAYEKVLTDVIARFRRQMGDEVHFLTGVDEHGQKVQASAKKKGIAPQQFVDEVSAEFRALLPKLNISNDDFIRTTEPRHQKVVRAILQQPFDKGEIYKAEYQGFYSTRQEQFLQNKDRNADGTWPEIFGEVTEITESATLVLNPADLAGTAYTCTKPFLDVRAVQVTPVGANSMARPPYYVIDDSTLPAKVYVFAHDASNNRTGGTVSLFITGV